MRAWAALPTLHIAGLRAIVRVNTRDSGFTCDQRTTARHWCAQNADHFATSSPLSAFFTEVVCNVGTTPPRTAATPPPIGGIAPCKGATRRRHAASQLLMLQKPHHRRGERRGPGEPGRSAREQRQGAAIARLLARGLRQSTTQLAQQEPHLAASGQNSPSTPALAARAVQNSPRTPALAARAVQNSPSTPALAACPVQNSPRTPTLTACPVQNSPRSPKMAQFGTVSACRESFVPF